MIWAVTFDWADGLIARKMKGRTGAYTDVSLLKNYAQYRKIICITYGEKYANYS